MTELTKDTFHEAIKSGVVVVDFWAEWCAPCKVYSLIFEKVSKLFSGKANFYKVDTESQFHLVAGLKINALPTTFIYKDGKVVERIEGLLRDAQLSEKIETYLK